MQILIRTSTGQPIYDQIVTQIKGQILSGALAPGTALPSIRSLARDLRISVITTKRAYDELEAQGLIHTMAGKGSFVAQPDTTLLREENLRRIEEHLTQATQLAAAAGVSGPELEALLHLLLTEGA